MFLYSILKKRFVAVYAFQVIRLEIYECRVIARLNFGRVCRQLDRNAPAATIKFQVLCQASMIAQLPDTAEVVGDRYIECVRSHVRAHASRMERACDTPREGGTSRQR
jgi:hypothetical protein